MTSNLAIFEGDQIRRHYDEQTETWWFSMVDIVQVLTQQPNSKAARTYWKVLKHCLNKEGSQLAKGLNSALAAEFESESESGCLLLP